MICLNVRSCLAFVVIGLVLAGCRPSEDPASSAPPAVAEGSTAASGDDADGSGGAEPTPPASDEVAERSDTPPTPEPPSLVEVMRRAGYTDASEADLAEFVHLPPGAEGEAGSFGDGAGEARVAFVRYPNARYARPHVTDVMERRRILPALGEAVVSDGRFVAHVRAIDRVTADAVADRIAESLGWTRMDAAPD